MSGYRDENIDFCRLMLKDSVSEARKLGAKIGKGRSWTSYSDRRYWYFDYMDFHWEGRADNAYHARSIGWEKWVESVNKNSERKV